MTEYHYHNHTVTEKRAPTDEAVKLLREMEQAARDSIIAAVSVVDNNFKGAMHIWRDPISCLNRYMFIYTMNGKRSEIPVDVYDHYTLEQNIEAVIEAVAKRVAIDMLQEPFTKLLKEVNFRVSR